MRQDSPFDSPPKSDRILARTMRAFLFACTFAVGLTAADPRTVSVHPFLGQRGGVFTVIVRGTNLAETKAVFVEEPGLRMALETAGETVKLRVETAADFRPGRYLFRLVTASGVSNALPLQITDSTVLTEPEGTHETPETAVSAAPGIYSGMIGKKGESDYYAFDAQAGETISFHVLSGLPSTGAAGGNANGFDPSLSIFEVSGSWFDAKRLNRIAFNDEPLWVLGRGTDAKLKHSFEKAGRYLVRLDAFSGQGGPDYSYILRISRGDFAPDPPAAKTDWEERTYQRPLPANRLHELAARGGRDLNSKAAIIAKLEGVIAQPGEAHRTTFRVDGPQDIAIEVETPDLAPPLFNPVVRLLDSKGEEVVTNFIAGRGACTGALNKGMAAKVIYPLRNPGEYTIEARELTADSGEAGFRYKVMVRSQVPHLGRVLIEEDHINLAPGGAKTVRVTFDREEDYRGAVAVSVDGLPEGVSVFAAADYEPDKDPPPFPGKRERYTARTERTVLAFSVAEGAPLMEMPKVVRVVVRPVADGKQGVIIGSKQIPIMVVAKP